jgi:hypothetical protein
MRKVATTQLSALRVDHIAKRPSRSQRKSQLAQMALLFRGLSIQEMGQDIPFSILFGSPNLAMQSGLSQKRSYDHEKWECSKGATKGLSNNEIGAHKLCARNQLMDLGRRKDHPLRKLRG